MEYTNQTFRERSIFDLNDDSNVMILEKSKLNTLFLIMAYCNLFIIKLSKVTNIVLRSLTSSPASTKLETWEMRKTEGLVPFQDCVTV